MDMTFINLHNLMNLLLWMSVKIYSECDLHSFTLLLQVFDICASYPGVLLVCVYRVVGWLLPTDGLLCHNSEYRHQEIGVEWSRQRPCIPTCTGQWVGGVCWRVFYNTFFPISQTYPVNDSINWFWLSISWHFDQILSCGNVDNIPLYFYAVIW